MRRCFLIFFLIVGLFNLEVKSWMQNHVSNVNTGLEESPVIETHSVVGERGFLPCNISSPDSDDKPLLVVFFRGQNPIYSVDARGGSLKEASHWTSKNLESRRPTFVVSSPPHGMILPAVKANDEGDYHCRVDFTSSPTRNLRVKLHVAVPPSRIAIVDGKGTEVHGIIGPYPLGDTLTLTCIVTGGKPRPKVTWWHEQALVDEVMEESKDQMTTNSLTLPNLTKKNLGWKLTCQSVNSNLTKPVMASVQIEMTFPPSEISIEGVVRPVQEGHHHNMSCITTGSRPSANITWWKDGKLIKNSHQKNQISGNATRSTISLIPTRRDDLSVIACRAENPLMPGSAIEDTRKLIVFYPPRIRLEPGRNLNMDDITEGDDVYFDCIIDSNPQVFRIEWMLNNRPLFHKVSDGVILSNQTLVLQRVKRNMTGDYRCKAANSLGKASSSSVHLSVKYPPYCLADQQDLYGSNRLNPVNVTCEVGGWPPPRRFFWSLNTSSEPLELSSNDFQEFPGKSVLLYRPKSHNDFGTVFCSSENELGRQTEPCVYQIVPAAPPEEPKDCAVSQNASEEGMIVVHCTPGWDGGLPQSFSLEVRKSESGPILAALKDQEFPTFSVSGLPAGRDFQLKVVAENSQGKSPPVNFIYFTPIDIAEERLSAATSAAAGWGSSYVDKTHLIGAAVGVAVVLAATFLVLIIVVKTKAASHARQPQPKAVCEVTSEIIKDEGGFSHNSGPDVILVTAETEDKEEEHKEIEEVRIEKERDHLENLEREKSFFRKSFPSSAPSDEQRIACHETEVLLPSDKRISSILTSSLLPSSSSSVTSVTPSTLFHSRSKYVAHPSAESFSPSFVHSSDTLPLHDDEGGRLISGLRSSLDIKKGLTYWSSSQPDPDESLDVTDGEFGSVGGASPAGQERESIV